MENALEKERQVLAQRYMPYAAEVARKYSRRRRQFGIEWDELRGAAMLGLVDAAQRYEPDQGVAFEAFSRTRIRGAIIDHLRRGGWHHPGYLKYLWEQEAAAASESGEASEGEFIRLRSLLGAKSAREFAEAANTIDALPYNFIVTNVECGHETVEPYADKNACPEQKLINENLRQYFLSLLEQLPEDEKSLLRMHYFEGLSYEQMRFHFHGSSKATLSRLHRRALQRLRVVMGQERLSCAKRISAARKKNEME